MSNHFELPLLRPLADIIRSNVWVNNDRLINLLINSIAPLGRDAIQQTFTAQFWATVIQDGSSQQLDQPTINVDTLNTLVNSRIWRQEPWIGDWTFSQFTRLNLNQTDRNRFGTPEFWNFLMGENYFRAGDNQQRPINDFYNIGEEARIRVQRYHAGKSFSHSWTVS